MNKKTLNTINKYNMLRSKSVILALSGGADSMALLYFFHTHKTLLGIELKAFHLNHNIRGEDAIKDEVFVKNYCESLNIPLYLYSEDIPNIAKSSGEGLEECGRRIRYNLLNNIDSNSMLATAHHLDDSAETAIFNLIRGTGIRGLCGILPVRDRIIRPLIECEKTEILDYCKTHNIPFQTDKTNYDTVFARNKIRLEIMPQLKELNPSFLEAFSKNSAILTEYEDYINQETLSLIKAAKITSKTNNVYSIDVLNKAHNAIRSNALLKIAESIAETKCSFSNVKAIQHILKNGGSTYLPNEKILIAEHGILKEVGSIDSLYPLDKTQLIDIISFDKNYKFNDKMLNFSDYDLNFNKKLQKVNNKLFINLIDCDTIRGKLILRSRNSGDFVCLYNRKCTKSLKKLFNEYKIPPSLRNSLLVLADEEGIVWLENFGVSERCCISPKTKKALRINVSKI